MQDGQAFPSAFSNLINVTVDAAIVNLPPVADAGPDFTVRDGANVTLNGTNSLDPNVESLSYAWAQVAGPTVTLAGAGTATPSFTAPEVTDTPLTFQLTVSDAAGLTDTDEVAVLVQGSVGAISNNKLAGALSWASVLLLGLGLLFRRIRWQRSA